MELVPLLWKRSTGPLLSAVGGLTIVVAQWPFGFNWGDEGLLWYASQRTAVGQIPLLDFFSYDPGRYYWSAFFFRLLHGNGLFEQIVADAAFGALGLAAIYVAMSKLCLSRPWRTAMLLTLGLMLGFPRHKIYEQALSIMCAAGIALVIENPHSKLRWFCYGTATGLAALIGRNSGLYFFIAGLLLIALLKFSGEQFAIGSILPRFAAGVVLGYSPMILMLCLVHGFAEAFYQSVVFTPHWQLKVPIPFPWHIHLKGLSLPDRLQARAVSFLCLAVPATYLFSIWDWIKNRQTSRPQLACAASLAGLPFLHHAFSRADFFHIAEGILPFAIAIGALAHHFWQRGRRRMSLAFFCAAFVLIATAWLPHEPMVQYSRSKPDHIRQVLIAGRNFYVDSVQAEVMQAAAKAFRDCRSLDGRFLAAPYFPGLYPFLETRAPSWELYYLYPRSPEFQEQEIHALERNRVSLVLLNRDATVDGRIDLRFDHTNPQLLNYILTHYEQSDVHLPDGFELYYSPQECKNPARTDLRAGAK